MLAALRQMHAAICLFRKNEFECAVTLAGAAEGILPATNEPHLFGVLRESPVAKEMDYNLLINWLQHPMEPEMLILPEFEVAIIIVRAISKFLAIYKAALV